MARVLGAIGGECQRDAARIVGVLCHAAQQILIDIERVLDVGARAGTGERPEQSAGYRASVAGLMRIAGYTYIRVLIVIAGGQIVALGRRRPGVIALSGS